MLFNTEDLRGGIPLSTFPRISSNEAVNFIDYIPTRTSKRLGCVIVSLEDANKYMISHATDLTTFVEDVSYINSVPYESLAFSVKPSSVYFNTIIREMYMNLQEQNIPVYIHIDYDSTESRLINMLCEECIQDNSIELLNIFQEGFWDSFLGGAGDGAAEAGGNFFSNILNNTVSKIGQSVRNNAAEAIDKNTWGRLGLDTTKQVHEWDSEKGDTVKTVTDKFGGLRNKLNDSKFMNKKFWQNNPNFKKNVVDTIVGVAQDGREAVGQGIMGFLQKYAGIDPDKPVTIEGMIDAATGAINKLRARPGTGGNQGIIQTIINKLIQIKNQLLGHRR